MVVSGKGSFGGGDLGSGENPVKKNEPYFGQQAVFFQIPKQSGIVSRT